MEPGRLDALYLAHLADLEQRYARVIAAAGFDGLVIHSGSQKKRTEFDDQYWSLRPTPHFHHWLPLSQADCALVIRPGQRPALYWLRVTSFWERPPKLENAHFRDSFEIVEIDSPEDVKSHLPSGPRLAYLGEDRPRGLSYGIAEEMHNPVGLLGTLDLLRSRKTPYEVACIEEANRIAALGHEAVLAKFRAGDSSELELHLAYLVATGQDDPETPYKNIVALGENAATLHHISYLKRPERKACQSLLLDAGATHLGYCSDITRTWVKGEGTAASAFGQLVDEVERMQLRLCRDVKLGVSYEQLHDEAHRQVGEILRTVGISRLSAEETTSSGISRVFFPHGLGHSLGLQCHDVGCALVKPKVENPYLRNTSIITEGQVFTIEPGIYFIDGLLKPLREGEHGGAIDWPLVGELATLGGVRIEDDLHVTGGASTTRNLTRELLPIGGGPV
ncbi:MAG: Xaa-Pro dipeptidase [Myxococcales bacterium]|nr:Xaa-Pro dipeptidase [Myxococcales bacterium]